MNTIKDGMQAPDFTLPLSEEENFKLSEHRGKSIILYFYPKDDTPGCTKQACSFRDLHPVFTEMDAIVLGISKDNVKKHKKFTEKYDLNFPLASDEDGSVCETYGVFKEKSMYGKTFMGIERTTFLIDPDGVIRKIWKKVKVDGHAEDVKTALNDMP